MYNIMNFVENPNTSELYPTPDSIIDKMLSGVDWGMIDTVLEPSAGKGDILRKIAQVSNIRHYSRENNRINIDAIEIDPNLRQILKYNFSEERRDDIDKRCQKLEEKKRYSRLTNSENEELIKSRSEKLNFFSEGVHIVHDNFLTFKTYKRYNLIIMNPPFSEGDKHLLKAIEIQKANGGSIICLLNAETLKNPYTNIRKQLLKELEEYDAKIEYVKDAFVSAERRTNVEIAIVRLEISRETCSDDNIYERMKKAENVEDFESNNTELAIGDYIKAAIGMYNAEVRTGLEIIRQASIFETYNMSSFTNKYAKPIINIKDSDGHELSANEFLKTVRFKYWEALLSNPKFVGKLTEKLQREYRAKIRELQDYDFTEYNIMTLSAEMNTHIKRGIEDEIYNLFEEMTVKHSCYEFQKNIHYYNGWKTNKAYKIGKKVILPCYGVFDHWDGKPWASQAQGKVADIERVLNFLDGNMTREINLWETIKENFALGVTSNIELKFFKITFYKKGTMHITFTNEKLIERFNIYVAQRKGWLPPSYGKKKYKDMTAEEQAVIDDFQGENAYNNVTANTEYYLASATMETNLLATSAA